MTLSEKKIDFLLKTALFDGVSKIDIEPLLHCLSYRLKKFEKNSFILRQGEKCEEAALVLSGSVHIITEDFWGNRTILSDISPGSVFAETFAFEGSKPLTVSALTVSDVEILFFSINKILTVCSSACVFHTRIIQNFVQVLALKNIMLNRKLLYLSFRSTREKLLSYLSDQSKNSKSENSSSLLPGRSLPIFCALTEVPCLLKFPSCKMRVYWKHIKMSSLCFHGRKKKQKYKKNRG